MKVKTSIAVGVAILALGICSSAFATVITQWNYNNAVLNQTLTPNIGTGSMSGRGLEHEPGYDQVGH